MVRQLWSAPLSDSDWGRKAAIGGLLLLLAPLLLPLVPALGYVVAVARGAGAGSAALPSWRPWRRRWRDGAVLLLALLLYGWPVLLVFGTVVAGLLTIGGPLAGTRWAAPLVGIAVVAQPIGLAWLLLGWVLLPLLLRRAATAPTLAAALSPLALWRLAAANRGALPMLWLQTAAVLLLSLPGLVVALVGFAFTLFWALLAVARLAARLAPG